MPDIPDWLQWPAFMASVLGAWLESQLLPAPSTGREAILPAWATQRLLRPFEVVFRWSMLGSTSSGCTGPIPTPGM